MRMFITLGYGHVIKNLIQPWDLTANIDACVHPMLTPSFTRSLPLMLPAAYMGIGSTAISMLKGWEGT